MKLMLEIESLIPFLTFENGNTENKRMGGFGSTNK